MKTSKEIRLRIEQIRAEAESHRLMYQELKKAKGKENAARANAYLDVWNSLHYAINELVWVLGQDTIVKPKP